MNAVPLAGIGQYVTCQACRCKYYVYVPPLEESRPTSSIKEPAQPRSAMAEEFEEPEFDSPPRVQNGVLFRQESLLATIHEDLVDLRKRIMIACFLFVLGCSAVIATVLLR